MPVAGGEETRVLQSVTWWMNFKVVDQGIYFLPDGKPSTIQFLRFTTGRIEPVVTIGRATAAGLTVSPDGRTILFSVYEHWGQDLMLVENFR
jgi:hypothetical protein